jgi:hypothetical protein
VIEGAGVGVFLDQSEHAVARIAALVEAALSDVPQTLLELCTRVHDAYGGLPPGRAPDLALTVDGHLGVLVADGLCARTDARPITYRSTG